MLIAAANCLLATQLETIFQMLHNEIPIRAYSPYYSLTYVHHNRLQPSSFLSFSSIFVPNPSKKYISKQTYMQSMLIARSLQLKRVRALSSLTLSLALS